jgi:hypothetical protein
MRSAAHHTAMMQIGAAPLAAFVAATLLMAAAEAPAEGDNGQSDESQTDYEAMCAPMIGERADLMGECVAAERDAHGFVMGWFGYNGLLTPEGQVDSMQLLEAQMDPLRSFYNTPASTASLCIDTTSEWIGLSECIAMMDQSAGMGLGPGMMDPGMGMGPGMGMDPGFMPDPGMN